MQLTITAVSRKQRTSKAGRPFTSVGLKTEEYGDRWVSGFGHKDNANWKAGDVVEVEVEDTGQYLNFTMPEKDMSPAVNNAATAEIMNAIRLKILPALEQLHQDNLAFDSRLQFLAQRAGLSDDDDFPEPDFDRSDNRTSH